MSKVKGKSRTYKKKDFNSGDGMMTAIWGPNMWHYLHTISFNYPVTPTDQDRKHYKEFILNMQYIHYINGKFSNSFYEFRVTNKRYIC